MSSCCMMLNAVSRPSRLCARQLYTTYRTYSTARHSPASPIQSGLHRLQHNTFRKQYLATKAAEEVTAGNGNGEAKITTEPAGPAITEPPADQTDKTNFSVKQRSENVAIFHRDSERLVNVNLHPKKPEVYLFFKKNEALVNVSLKQFDELERVVLEEEDTVQNVTSVEDAMWKRMEYEPGQLIHIYMKLAKIRLTGLVVVTTMVGYGIAPGAFDPLVFTACTLGTGMTSAAANSINQFLEIPYDSQMNRTKNRPLVRGQISSLHGMTFAAVTGLTGVAMLTYGVNDLTAALGAFNLVLYTMGYTPLKRLSIINTWVGSIVGAIPPIMGWTAATGSLDGAAVLLGAMLFCWQFPHFNALSWNLRADYSRAGYRMMSVVNPTLCKLTALGYSISMIPICALAPVLDITTWSFAADSLPLNLYLSFLAWRFYRKDDSNSSRKLFRFSLVHIPALMVLMLISKKHYGEQKEKPIPAVDLLKNFYEKMKKTAAGS